MEIENIKQQVEELQLNTTLLKKDVSAILPSIITILDSIDQTLKSCSETQATDSENRKLLVSCIKDVNGSVDKYVTDYGNLQQQACNIIAIVQKKEGWIEKKVDELKEYVSQIPAKTEISHSHRIDIRSRKWIIVLASITAFSLVLLGISIAFFFSQQNLKDDSLKLRMIRLEQPSLTVRIDSIYHKDSKNAEYLVNKREEEVKLMMDVMKKRKEIKTIEGPGK
ncbi:hypothetical protein AAKU52_000396 [Pedobacter sp. CG_S7]|uniref:hypothetical protein n=1 Tax=Pedobacter sp. CG_S7 TaxID=3143930 RepID=UPI00339B900E